MDDESKNLIKAWINLADKESPHLSTSREDVYFRFMALWVGLNAFLTREYKHIRGDREKVRAFANESSSALLHREKLSDSIYSKAVEDLKKLGVKDMQNTNRVYRINSSECFTEVMECVYQVRCNLFHGDKSIDDERDNKLVKAAHTIVAAHLKAKINRGLNEH